MHLMRVHQVICLTCLHDNDFCCNKGINEMLSDVGCHVTLKGNDYTSIEILDLRMVNGLFHF